MPELDQRIAAMHRRDTTIAWAFVIGLWLAMFFVALAILAVVFGIVRNLPFVPYLRSGLS